MAFEDIATDMADQQSMKASLSPTGFSSKAHILVRGYCNLYDSELRDNLRGIGNVFYLDHPVQGMLNNASYVLDGTFGSWTGSTQSVDVALTTAGRATIANWLAGNNPAPPSYIAYGTGTDSVSITQTALTAEVGRRPFSGGYAPGISTITASIPAPSNSGNIFSEVGLFNAATGGVMFSRRVLNPTISSSATQEKQLIIDFIRESQIPVMDQCGNDVLKWMVGSASNVPTYFGFGTSSLAVTKSDYTTMADEAVTRLPVNYAELTNYDTVRFETEIDATTGVGTNFRLIGLFNSSGAGDLYGYFGIPVIYKTAQFAVDAMFSIGIVSNIV